MKNGVLITGKLIELGATAVEGQNFARISRNGLPDLMLTGLTDNEVRTLAPQFMERVDVVVAGPK